VVAIIGFSAGDPYLSRFSLVWSSKDIFWFEKLLKFVARTWAE
jgi:hypothetical protein